MIKIPDDGTAPILARLMCVGEVKNKGQSAWGKGITDLKAGQCLCAPGPSSGVARLAPVRL